MAETQHYKFPAPTLSDPADITKIGKGFKKVDEAMHNHSSSATLDHPDGSVTTEKIKDGAVTPKKLSVEYIKSSLSAKVTITVPVLRFNTNYSGGDLCDIWVNSDSEEINITVELSDGDRKIGMHTTGFDIKDSKLILCNAPDIPEDVVIQTEQFDFYLTPGGVIADYNDRKQFIDVSSGDFCIFLDYHDLYYDCDYNWTIGVEEFFAAQENQLTDTLNIGQLLTALTANALTGNLGGISGSGLSVFALESRIAALEAPSGSGIVYAKNA